MRMAASLMRLVHQEEHRVFPAAQKGEARVSDEPQHEENGRDDTADRQHLLQVEIPVDRGYAANQHQDDGDRDQQGLQYRVKDCRIAPEVLLVGPADRTVRRDIHPLGQPVAARLLSTRLRLCVAARLLSTRLLLPVAARLLCARLRLPVAARLLCARLLLCGRAAGQRKAAAGAKAHIVIDTAPAILAKHSISLPDPGARFHRQPRETIPIILS